MLNSNSTNHKKFIHSQLRDLNCLKCFFDSSEEASSTAGVYVDNNI